MWWPGSRGAVGVAPSITVVLANAAVAFRYHQRPSSVVSSPSSSLSSSSAVLVLPVRGSVPSVVLRYLSPQSTPPPSSHLRHRGRCVAWARHRDMTTRQLRDAAAAVITTVTTTSPFPLTTAVDASTDATAAAAAVVTISSFPSFSTAYDVSSRSPKDSFTWSAADTYLSSSWSSVTNRNESRYVHPTSLLNSVTPIPIAAAPNAAADSYWSPSTCRDTGPCFCVISKVQR